MFSRLSIAQQKQIYVPYLLSGILVSFLLLGCEKRATEADVDAYFEVEVKTDHKPRAEETKPVVKDYEYYKTWLPTAPMEDLDDPKQWEDIRVEFSWRDRSKYKNTVHIYSMKPDGSDIRMAANADLFFSERKASIARYLRSPNNRYIVARLNTGPTYLTVLVDLRTQTTKILDKAVSKPRFAWSPDSKYIIYYGERQELMRYDLKEETLTKVDPRFTNSFGFFLLHNGHVLLTYKTHYRFIDYKNNTLYEQRLTRNHGNGAFMSISPDQRYLSIAGGAVTCFYDLTEKYGAPSGCFGSVTNHDLSNIGLYYFESSRLKYRSFSDFDTEEEIISKKFGMGKIGVIGGRSKSSKIPNYPYLTNKK